MAEEFVACSAAAVVVDVDVIAAEDLEKVGEARPEWTGRRWGDPIEGLAAVAGTKTSETDSKSHHSSNKN